ncbi:MAG: ABC1 kinase family protein, partial [Clostridia bacterium]
MAAASIGQVYRARLHDGQAVVVKVRRPGIVDDAETDFEIMRGFAEMAERRTEWGRQYGLTVLVDELVATLRDEMDFQSEGRYTDQARAAGGGAILVPQVYWQYTRPDVLVMSRIEGIKIMSGQGLARRGIDPDRLAARIVEAVYRQIFLDGFFHADPHPGNVHVSPDGVPIFLDWGMVGHLSPTMRERSIDLLLGMMERRPDRVVRALLRMRAVDSRVDKEALTRDVEHLRRRYYEASLAEFSLGQALTELFGLAWRYHIRVPGEYALLAKTAVTLDGLVRRLNPEGSLVEYGRGLAAPLLWTRFGPRHLATTAAESGLRWLQLLEGLPDDAEEALQWVRRGELHIVLEHKNLDTMLAHWERLANRVGLSFVLGGLVVGTALITHPGHLDRLFGLPIGEYTFMAAVAMALFILLAALKGGRL